MKNRKYIEEIQEKCNNAAEKIQVLERELDKRIELITELRRNRETLLTALEKSYENKN